MPLKKAGEGRESPNRGPNWDPVWWRDSELSRPLSSVSAKGQAVKATRFGAHFTEIITFTAYGAMLHNPPYPSLPEIGPTAWHTP